MELKQRHGCVTAWLVLMIIANSLTAVLYLFMGDTVIENSPVPIPPTILTVLAIIGIANLSFSVILFQWKKWAFWAFAATSILTLGINLSIGMGIGTSLFGLVGVGVLYGILQLEKDGATAWQNLE